MTWLSTTKASPQSDKDVLNSPDRELFRTSLNDSGEQLEEEIDFTSGKLGMPISLVRWPHTSEGKEWPSKKQGAQGRDPGRPERKNFRTCERRFR